MTIKVVALERMVNEEVVVVIKSHCIFVKNVTFPLVQTVLNVFSSFLMESQERRSKRYVTYPSQNNNIQPLINSYWTPSHG